MNISINYCDSPTGAFNLKNRQKQLLRVDIVVFFKMNISINYCDGMAGAFIFEE